MTNCCETSLSLSLSSKEREWNKQKETKNQFGRIHEIETKLSEDSCSLVLLCVLVIVPTAQ